MDFNALMLAMPEQWRYRWCPLGGPCACVGCANVAGKIPTHMHEQWAEWVAAHPQPEPAQPAPLDPARLPK